MRYIIIGLVMVLTAACGSSSDEETPEAKQPPVISVYVYSPDNPVVTRAGEENVNPIENDINESTIITLKIWVFETGTENRIAYFSPTQQLVKELNSSSGVTYQLSVSEAFATAVSKPNVDVYVVANEASCGITELGEKTKRADLEDALIQKTDNSDPFGLKSLTGKVPETGLPMSGVLRNVAVSGSSPVYKLQNVKLVRAVSKVRFVFCREKPAGDQAATAITINSVELDKGMIPLKESLFKPIESTWTWEYAENDSKDFLSGPLTGDDIPQTEDPLKYVYQNQEAQVYEDLIDAGVNKTVKNDQGLDVPAPELKQVGPFYLRESAKALKGRIKYLKGTEIEENSKAFEMAAEGEFLRNHTWIVYVFYSKSGLVAVHVVVRNWSETLTSHEVYNW